MAFSTKITNTTNSIIEICYRMPKEKGGNSLPITIPIQPRALLNEVFFPNEECFLEMKRQNEILFARGYLIEGKTNEKEVVAKHEELSQDRFQNVKEKVEKTTDDIQASAENVNASVEIKAGKSGELEKEERASRKRH